jgi:hypothetical protein
MVALAFNFENEHITECHCDFGVMLGGSGVASAWW